MKILGTAAVGGLSLLKEETCSQTALIGGVDTLLAEANGCLRAAGNGLCHLHDSVVELFHGDNYFHKSDTQSLSSIYLLTGESETLGLADTNKTCKSCGAAHISGESQLHLG